MKAVKVIIISVCTLVFGWAYFWVKSSESKLPAKPFVSMSPPPDAIYYDSLVCHKNICKLWKQGRIIRIDTNKFVFKGNEYVAMSKMDSCRNMNLIGFKVRLSKTNSDTVTRLIDTIKHPIGHPAKIW